MELITLANAPPFEDGPKGNVRAILLRPGQALPTHTHGDPDLMPYVAEGDDVIATDAGTVPSPHGALAYYRGEEERWVRNDGTERLTWLAFLAPSFPPACSG